MGRPTPVPRQLSGKKLADRCFGAAAVLGKLTGNVQGTRKLVCGDRVETSGVQWLHLDLVIVCCFYSRHSHGGATYRLLDHQLPPAFLLPVFVLLVYHSSSVSSLSSLLIYIYVRRIGPLSDTVPL